MTDSAILSRCILTEGGIWSKFLNECLVRYRLPEPSGGTLEQPTLKMRREKIQGARMCGRWGQRGVPLAARSRHHHHYGLPDILDAEILGLKREFF